MDFSQSLDPTQPKQEGQQQLSKSKNQSGKSALLSLLSQDDFTKLKKDIQTQMSNIEGKIEEIPASEEEDPHVNMNEENPIVEEEDDEQVVLEVREKPHEQAAKELKISTSELPKLNDEESQMGETPKQNTKY